MATVKKKKSAKQKLWDKRKAYHNTLPENERNPNHKEDFEKVLSKLFPPVKPKGINRTKPRKRKSSKS